jgi:RNA polymerase sigma factor (sigma-70 family)
VNRSGQLATTGQAAVPVDGRSFDKEISLFYGVHHRAVSGFLVVACGCPVPDAEDIVQDTILVIQARYWPTVRALEKPEAYWYKTAQRRCRRLLRQRAKRVAEGDPVERLLGVADPADQFAVVDRYQALIARIRELPPRQRQVLWLRLAEDFSESDTAEILGISVGSVKRQLHDAKERMKELLRKDSTTWGAETW